MSTEAAVAGPSAARCALLSAGEARLFPREKGRDREGLACVDPREKVGRSNVFARRPPASAMSTRTIAVLTLVGIAVTATAKPEVWSVRPGDPDTRTAVWHPHYHHRHRQPLQEVEKSAAAGVTMPKDEVDKLLTFHEMGSGDVAEISLAQTTRHVEPFNVLDKLVITVTDKTGASTAVLEGFTLLGALQGQCAEADRDTEFCDPESTVGRRVGHGELGQAAEDRQRRLVHHDSGRAARGGRHDHRHLRGATDQSGSGQGVRRCAAAGAQVFGGAQFAAPCS